MSSPLVDPAEALAELREQHRALVDMMAVLGRAGGDVQPVLDMVAETAGRLSGGGNCYLWLTEGDELRVQAAYGGREEGLAYERAHPHQGADSRTLTGRVVQQRAVVQIPDIRDDPSYEWEGQPVAGYRALLGVPILAESALLGVLGISWAEPQVFTEERTRLVLAFADQAAIAITNARLLAAVRRQREELARFLSPAVADLVSSDEGRRLLAGHRAYVTVLFADLRGFTSFAEAAEPEELFEVLSQYHAEVGRLLHRHGGTLEHFAGDGLMIFFNDPVPMPGHESKAVHLAIDMRDRIQLLAAEWRRRGIELGVGIGIASGYATLGRIGFEGRFDYAAIGTVTILASRLSSAAAAGQILVNQRLYAAVEDIVDGERTDELDLKGYARPVAAWIVTQARGARS